jgi:hypothetical protein
MSPMVNNETTETELEILCIVGRLVAQVLGRLHSDSCQFQ